MGLGLMINSPSGRPRKSVLWSALVLSLLLMVSGLPFRASAGEIPHENYDLVTSNTDVLISMLSSSIVYSEYALADMYNTTMTYVEQNLTIVRGILGPADELMTKIRTIAASYLDLSNVLPPFANLSAQLDTFERLETGLLEVRARIVSASDLANLTGNQLLATLGDLSAANTLILNMNSTIDQMLVSANSIIALKVNGRQPFTHNDLIPLIEKLRDLLKSMGFEIDQIVNNSIHFQKTRPFLTLWLDRANYHLGDIIRGGGYLFVDGNFSKNYLVLIAMDGTNLSSAKTNAQGRYSFEYQIPVQASWLGDHIFQSWSSTVVGIIFSDPKTITVTLLPTTFTLTISPDLMAPTELATLSAKLLDTENKPVPNAGCHLILDGSRSDFTTDSDGAYARSWLGSDLGYGIHSFQAFFDGGLPYANSSSSIVELTVNIPTNVTVHLFADRFRLDYNIVGNGQLTANGSTPLAGQEVTILIDGKVMANTTTGSQGEFAFSIPAKSFAVGGHVLTAEFLKHDPIWRYSEAQVGFSVFYHTLGKYPFLPVIPGWGGMRPDIVVPDLFFGQYAYVVWLLVLMTLGVGIRAYQMGKQRARAIAKGESFELLDEAPATIGEGASEADITTTLAAAEEMAPRNPNERVVWYYHRLLSFLSKKQKISLRASMTHWEVARLLSNLGYPSEPVDRATLLFEKALYSGRALDDDDSVSMSTLFTSLVSSTTRRPGSAV